MKIKPHMWEINDKIEYRNTLTDKPEQLENDIVNILDNSMIIKNVVNNEFKIYIYDHISYDILKYREIIDLLGTLTKDDKVKIYIESYGGCVGSGMVICAAIKDCKAHVTTYSLGNSFSMGFVIWAFGDTLELFPGAITMFHNISSFIHGSLSSIQETIDFNKNILNNIIDMCLEKGILLQEEIDDVINKDKDLYIPYDVMIKRIKPTED